MLGAIVEQVSGRSFAEGLDAYLLQLGMTESTFWAAKLAGDAAHGHVGSGIVNPPPWYGSRYALPFTGLWTTGPDLTRSRDDPGAPLHAMTVASGHGLGAVHGTRLGQPSIEHDGSIQGFYAALVVLPQSEVVVSVMTNGGREQPAESDDVTPGLVLVLVLVVEVDTTRVDQGAMQAIFMKERLNPPGPGLFSRVDEQTQARLVERLFALPAPRTEPPPTPSSTPPTAGASRSPCRDLRPAAHEGAWCLAG